MKIQSCLFLTITTKFEKRALKTKKTSQGGKRVLQESGLKNQLVHHKEGIYFALTLLFSILTYVALLFSIIGIAMIIALMLISYFFHAISMASIRRNGVRLSERQFPELYQKAVKLAGDMEIEKMPSVYVLESMGTLNAFATRFFGKNMVVVYSEIFDLSEEEREEELLFVLAHEFAHIKRRHVMVHLLLLPAMFIPFLGEAYGHVNIHVIAMQPIMLAI